MSTTPDEEMPDAEHLEQALIDTYSSGRPTDGITLRLREVVKLLEPVDLETAIKNIEEEPLPGDPEERRAAAVNRADRAELLRAFLALRETGRAIVRRLEDDTAGRARDE